MVEWVLVVQAVASVVQQWLAAQLAQVLLAPQLELVLLLQVWVLVLVLVLALVPAQVLVLVLPLLLVEPLESKELDLKLPSLVKQRIFLMARLWALHSDPHAADMLMEEHSSLRMQVVHNQDQVHTSTCILDPCIDLHNLRHTCYSNWVDHKELYILGNLHLHTHPGKPQRSVAHRTAMCIAQPCRKPSHTAAVRRQVDRLDHTLPFHNSICT